MYFLIQKISAEYLIKKIDTKKVLSDITNSFQIEIQLAINARVILAKNLQVEQELINRIISIIKDII
jgi:hypothetical protein